MKNLFMFLVMTSFFATLGFAAETTTDCIQMKEEVSRANPKANLDAIKAKPRSVRGSAAQ